MSVRSSPGGRSEKLGIMLSGGASFFLALLALFFTLSTGSQTVALDGTYSLLTGLCAGGALRVAALVRKPDDARFPFGYAAFEPLMNLIRGALVGGVTLYAAFLALLSLGTGGRDTANGFAAIYGLATAVLCFSLAIRLAKLAKRTNAPLLEVDSQSWRVDGLISLGVTLAFLVATIGEILTPSASWLPLVDPGVMLLLSLVTVPVPFHIMRNSVLQLLTAAPPETLRSALLHVTRAELESVRLRSFEPRVTLVGRELYYNLYLVLEEELSLEQADVLRSRIHTACESVAPNCILDVIFTRELRWAAPETAVSDSRTVCKQVIPEF